MWKKLILVFFSSFFVIDKIFHKRQKAIKKKLRDQEELQGGEGRGDRQTDRERERERERARESERESEGERKKHIMHCR